MSDGAVDARQDAQSRVFDRALDTIATVPAALTELGGKIDASRQASSEAHTAHAAKLDKFSDVIAANTAAMGATTASAEALAAELKAIHERNATIAADLQNANTRLAAEKARAGATVLATVTKWLPHIAALVAGAYALYKGVTPPPGTTTTTATTTITAPADATP